MKQLTFFDLIPEEENKEADLCETCRYFEKGCCSYDEPLGRYCVEGDAYELKVPETAPQFPESDFAEIVDYINKKLGINFHPEEWKPGGVKAYYKCKVSKNLRLSLSRSRFSEGVHNGAEFIGVGWDIKTGGGGSPVDTVGEALDYFEDVLSKYK